MNRRTFTLLFCITILLFSFSGKIYSLNGKIEKMPSGEPIYFTVANDVLQELKYSTIPIIRNGAYYIPYTVLTNNFNIRSSYSETEKVLYLSNMRDNIKFDLNAGCAYDKSGQIAQTAILSKGTVFVPAEFICQYMGLTFAYISEGPIIRIRDANSTYPDIYLGVLYQTRMHEMLDAFLKSFESEPDNPPTENSPVSIYLTIDDGPTQYTSSIVDLLNQYNAKATFFVIGSHIPEYEQSIRKLYISGHQIGLHSFSHAKEQFYASPEAMLDELQQTNGLIRDILQTQSRIVRLPFGSSEREFSESFRTALHDAGYLYWDWTIQSNDLNQNSSPYTVYRNIITQLSESTREEEVILLHDNERTLEILPLLLDYLNENSQYSLKTISSLTPPINFTNMQ